MKKRISDKLHSAGLRVTPQRVWIYDYLERYKTHPDAEEVYEAVKNSEMAITMSTVYNVLQAFVDHGLAVEVKLDGDRVRYDANVNMHGHFICKECKSIYDFNVKSLTVTGLEGFETDIRDVYFSGVCKKCKNKI